MSYSFDVVSGELTVTLKRGEDEVRGRVGLYGKVLAIGVAVAGYMAATGSDSAKTGSSEKLGRHRRGDSGGVALLLLLVFSAVFSALWAQFSHRSGSLWFVLGFVFSVFAWLVMLYLTRRDIRSGRLKRWTE